MRGAESSKEKNRGREKERKIQDDPLKLTPQKLSKSPALYEIWFYLYRVFHDTGHPEILAMQKKFKTQTGHP